MTLRSPTVLSGMSKLWCRVHIDPVLRCFANPEGLNYDDLLEGVVPELASWITT
jgi:hypothetical protein